MNAPQMLKYTKEHEWIKVLEDGTLIIGITDFAQSELGDIVYVEVETVGDTIEKDEVFGTVEAVKTTSDLFMPVKGEVLEFNSELNEDEGDNPGLVNEDPFEKGWIIKIKPSNDGDVEGLLTYEAYQDHIS